MSEVAYKNRSSEEMQMRALIAPHLRSAYPGSRIIHELPLRYSTSRIDMAAVLPDKIVSVEIKSSKDTLSRLHAQLLGFAPICDRVVVALAPRWNEQLPDKREAREWGWSSSPQYTEAQQIVRDLPYRHIAIWTVDHETGDVTPTKPCNDLRLPWFAELLDVLHVAELLEVAQLHRISVARRPTHEHLVGQCAELMTGREIRRAVCRALRARSGFAKESDPPILDVAGMAGAA